MTNWLNIPYPFIGASHSAGQNSQKFGVLVLNGHSDNLKTLGGRKKIAKYCLGMALKSALHGGRFSSRDGVLSFFFDKSLNVLEKLN